MVLFRTLGGPGNICKFDACQEREELLKAILMFGLKEDVDDHFRCVLRIGIERLFLLTKVSKLTIRALGSFIITYL